MPAENILQLLPEAVAPGKEELAAYWRKVAKRALPYLGGRLLKLVRHTRGTTFYHTRNNRCYVRTASGYLRRVRCP